MATEKSEALINELLDFSVKVIDFCKNSDLPKSVSSQLIRSATSIGANFSEAQEASSKKDFTNKIFIAKKEAFETKYWLRLSSKIVNNKQKAKTDLLIEETQKYLMILQKIINTLRDK